MYSPWVQVLSKSRGRNYWYNIETYESRWTQCLLTNNIDFNHQSAENDCKMHVENSLPITKDVNMLENRRLCSYASRSEAFAAEKVFQKDILKKDVKQDSSRSGGHEFVLVCKCLNCSFEMRYVKQHGRFVIDTIQPHSPNCISTLPNLAAKEIADLPFVKAIAEDVHMQSQKPPVRVQINLAKSLTDRNSTYGTFRRGIKLAVDALPTSCLDSRSLVSFLSTFEAQNGGVSGLLIDANAKRYITIDATHSFGTEGMTSGKHFIGEFILGNNTIMPGFWGLGRSEGNLEWEFFLKKSKETFTKLGLEYVNYVDNEHTCFAADRAAAIIGKLNEVYPRALRRADLRHVIVNMTGVRNSGNSNGDIKHVYTVANAKTVDARDKAMKQLEEVNPLGAKYLIEQVGLETISMCSFLENGVKTYGQKSGVTAVDSECARFWRLGFRDQSPLNACIKIQKHWHDLFSTNINIATALKISGDLLVPYARLIFSNYLSKTGLFTHITTEDGLLFDCAVQSSGDQTSIRIVNWFNKTCTCSEWQDLDLPCIHAVYIAHLYDLLKDFEKFVHHAFGICYRASSFCEIFQNENQIQLVDMKSMK